MDQNTLAIVSGIIGSVAGISGMILSIMSYLHNRIEAINAFYEAMNDQAFTKGRQAVYALEENQVCDNSHENNLDVALVLNFFQQWGILVQKRHLPFWVFRKTASGIAAVRLYEKLKPTIDDRRKNNPMYANYYDYLYRRIKKSKFYKQSIH